MFVLGSGNFRMLLFLPDYIEVVFLTALIYTAQVFRLCKDFDRRDFKGTFGWSVIKVLVSRIRDRTIVEALIS